MSFHSRRFDRAARTYAGHSAIQERMADVLLSLLEPMEPGDRAESGNLRDFSNRTDTENRRSANPSPILEMGCGTGHFTRRIRSRFPRSHLLVTDVSPRMLDAASKSLAGLAGPAPAGRSAMAGGDAIWTLFDAEGQGGRLPAPILAAAPFSLAVGNALVQWFPDLTRHFALVHALLAEGGSYLVSGFSRENFPELNAILREPPFAYRTFPGHLPEVVRNAAMQAGFTIEGWKEESLESAYASPEDFLSAIKSLGSARRPEAGQPLTRGKLRHLTMTYRESYPAGTGVRVTWKPWYALLRKQELD